MNTNTTTTTIKRERIIDSIIEFFDSHEDLFTDCIEALDACNGYLGDDRYYEMSELDEIFHDSDPTEILSRAFFGYDEDVTISGDPVGDHSAFNPNRDYFRFNGYGNLVSSDYRDYSGYNDSYVIESLLENRSDVACIEDDENLSALFDDLESCAD